MAPGGVAGGTDQKNNKVTPGSQITVEFVMELERIATSSDVPFGLRYYAAMFVLMTLASLRFCDTRDVADFWVTDTSVCGISIGHKSKSAELMVWAAQKKRIFNQFTLVSPAD